MAVYWDKWFLLFGLESSVLIVWATACGAMLLTQSQVECLIHVCIDCQHISPRKNVTDVKIKVYNYTVIPLADLG